MAERNFPYIPKSTKLLERGQFWAIPLSDGSYGAGCVIGMHTSKGKPSARSFLAGVIAWHGNQPPTAEALSGCEIYRHSFAHIKIITESGGKVLGKATLEFGSLPSEAESLSFSAWGYKVPVLLAHQYAGIKINTANDGFQGTSPLTRRRT